MPPKVFEILSILGAFLLGYTSEDLQGGDGRIPPRPSFGSPGGGLPQLVISHTLQIGLYAIIPAALVAEFCGTTLRPRLGALTPGWGALFSSTFQVLTHMAFGRKIRRQARINVANFLIATWGRQMLERGQTASMHPSSISRP